MRVGVMVPVFHSDARRCVEFAKRAEELGFDSVSVADHLYPLEQPERTALAWLPIMTAIGDATVKPMLFPLIARTGTQPNVMLAKEFQTLHSLFGERFIAAIGIGDARSKGEYAAYGVEYKSFEARLVDAEDVLTQLSAFGVPAWVSAKSEVIQTRLARLLTGINLWDATTAEVKATRARFPEKTISWAGPWKSKSEFDSELLGDDCADWLIFSFGKDAEAQLEQVAKWRASVGL